MSELQASKYAEAIDAGGEKGEGPGRASRCLKLTEPNYETRAADKGKGRSFANKKFIPSIHPFPNALS